MRSESDSHHLYTLNTSIVSDPEPVLWYLHFKNLSLLSFLSLVCALHDFTSLLISSHYISSKLYSLFYLFSYFQLYYIIYPSLLLFFFLSVLTYMNLCFTSIHRVRTNTPAYKLPAHIILKFSLFTRAFSVSTIFLSCEILFPTSAIPVPFLLNFTFMYLIHPQVSVLYYINELNEVSEQLG